MLCASGAISGKWGQTHTLVCLTIPTLLNLSLSSGNIMTADALFSDRDKPGLLPPECVTSPN